MIIIQIILIVGIIALFGWFLRRQQTTRLRAWQKVGLLLFVLFALFAIMFPESSNQLAHLVGVSRGADLMLYLTVLGFIFLSLQVYIKSKRHQQSLTVVVRKLALLEAAQQELKKPPQQAK